MTSRNRCHGPAPSMAAASMTSLGIWVMPAYRVKATNGMPIHTTMSVATKKNDSGSDSQEWPSKSPPSLVSSQFTSPYWVSKIHCHTTVAVSAGMAQASSSATLSRGAHARPEPPEQQRRQRAEHHGERDVHEAEHERAAQHVPEVRVAEDRR